MSDKSNRWAFIGAILAALVLILAGCASREGYSDWQWKQYSPNYQPLPGEDR